MALAGIVADAAGGETFSAKIPEETQWGVTFGFYGSNAYFTSDMAKEEIDAIARTGANWVTVVATVWQDTCQSTFQYADFDLTPDDLALKDRLCSR